MNPPAQRAVCSPTQKKKILLPTTTYSGAFDPHPPASGYAEELIHISARVSRVRTWTMTVVPSATASNPTRADL